MAEIEPIYLEKKDTPEIRAMGRAFGKVSPDEQAAITRDVPGPVFTMIVGVFGRSYRKNIAPVWESQPWS